mgnify:CR=1|jgi:hypothetical protein
MDRQTATVNFRFCDDLDAPQLCVIMNRFWWRENDRAILSWLDMQGATQATSSLRADMLYIADPMIRTAFTLKWS